MERLDTAQAKAAVLAEALPYIQDFKGSVVLVKLGGSVMEVEENLDSIMADIAFMSAVGIKVVVVHGGGKAISKAIKMSGHEPKFVDGLRVTDGPTMEIVRKTLNNVVNPDIVARLNLKGANARPLHGNWIFSAKKITAPDQCGSCPKKEVCGVCAAVRVTETGRFDQVPAYMCQWTDAVIEKTWEAYLERDEENGH
jgi:acetylglutamate kinase